MTHHISMKFIYEAIGETICEAIRRNCAPRWSWNNLL